MQSFRNWPHQIRLRHKKHTGGNWINRDPAAVADTTSGNVRAIWCEDGNVIAIDPPGYLPIYIVVNVKVSYYSFFLTLTSTVNYSKISFRNSCIYTEI